MASRVSGILLAGLGNILRRDDGLGVVAAKMTWQHLLAHLPKETLSQISRAEVGISPIDYIHELASKDWVIVCDAIQMGLKPGEFRKIAEKDLRESLGRSALSQAVPDPSRAAPCPDREIISGKRYLPGLSPHDFSFLDAIDLARSLSRKSDTCGCNGNLKLAHPGHVVFFGMEPLDLSLGEGLSEPVTQALPAFAQAILCFTKSILYASPD